MRFFLLIVFSLCLFSIQAVAAEPVPGQSCSAYTAGAVIRTGGPSSPAYTLTCTGGVWVDSGASGGSVDHTPDNVTFTDLINQTAAGWAVSNTVTISGVGSNESVMINITDGVSQYNVNGETVWDADASDYVDSWNAGSAKRLLMNGDTIKIRTIVPSTMRTTRTVNVYIGTLTTSWNVTSRDCPSSGSICADGSMGAFNNAGTWYRVTDVDAPSTYKWATNNGSVDTSLVNCSTNNGTGSCAFGQGSVNTATLTGLSDASSPYSAAQYCDSLVADGQSDWFLPSLSELNALYSARVAMGFSTTTNSFYWSSSEYSTGNAWYRNFDSSGTVTNSGKSGNSMRIRCMRVAT